MSGKSSPVAFDGAAGRAAATARTAAWAAAVAYSVASARAAALLLACTLMLSGAGCVKAPGAKDRSPSIPTISLSPGQISIARPCTLAVRSQDPDHDPLSYRLKISSGGLEAELPWTLYLPEGQDLGLILTMDPGDYRISARCRDTTNRSTPYSAEERLLVVDQPPARPTTPRGDTLLFVPETGFFSSIASDIEGETVAFRHDPGDGSPLSNWSDFSQSPAGYEFSHAYGAPGIFGVRVQAQDAGGNLSGWSDSLRVVARPNATLLSTFTDLPLPIDGVVAAGGYAYLTAFGAGLRIVDVRAPSAPVLVGGDGSFASTGIAFGPHGILLLTHGSLMNYDVSTPTAPRRIASTALVSGKCLSVRGDLAAVGTGNPARGVLLFDVSRPDTLIARGSAAMTDVQGVALDDGHLYVSRGQSASLAEFIVLSTTDPLHPEELGSVTANGTGPVWTDGGGFAWFVSGLTLKVVDVRTPSVPRVVREVETYGIPISVDGGHGYLAVCQALHGFTLFDLSQPDNPAPAAHWTGPNGVCQRMWCGEDALYAANFDGGLLAFSYPAPFDAGAALPGPDPGAFREEIRLGGRRIRIISIRPAAE